MIYEVIIIGAGPSGIAAAIQLKRFGISPVIIEKNAIGGLLRNANLVENYLGFPNGISGLELVNLMHLQLKKYDIDFVQEEVLDISFLNNEKKFEIKTNSKNYKSNYVILSTGTKPKNADFEIDADVENKVFYEVYNILNVKNKDICIVGAGDAALDYALNLAKNNKVQILNKSSKIKAIPLLINRAKEAKNVKYIENVSIQRLEKVNVTNKIKVVTKKDDNLVCDYVLIAIGREQNIELYKEEFKDNDKFFVVGDAKNGILRQTAIAVGNGLEAAQKIFNKLNLE
jgi:thioredoxin reductase